MIADLWNAAKAYGLGTPESRAIVFAIEHAIATEAATAAETVKLGSVHEGAGRNGIAQTKSGSRATAMSLR